MNVSLIGPSGAGKSTHTAALAQQFNLVHLSTGDLFREHLENYSALGIIARDYMAQGEMVPDEVVEAMVEERVRRIAPVQGILFDGFPRTGDQARFLDELFDDLDRKLDAFVYLDVSVEESLNRIAGREVCSFCQAPFRRIYQPFVQCPTGRCQGEHLGRRIDDTPQIARARLRSYHRVTGPLLDYIQQTKRVAILDGEQDVGAVGQALSRTLKEIESNQFRPASCGEVGMLMGRVSVPVPPMRPPAAVDMILIGAPGSGKGTQAGTLAAELQLPHIATGDLFRDHIRKQTDLGKLAKTYMDRGELVPDGVTEAMVDERISQPDARDGFILDGFPRTIAQAQALGEILEAKQRHVAGAIFLRVPDEEIILRLSSRMICRQCQTPYHFRFKPSRLPNICDRCSGPLYQRDDDKPETVKARLKTFHLQTEPLVGFYAKAGLLYEVDGTGQVQEVCERVFEAAREIQRRVSIDAIHGRRGQAAGAALMGAV